MRTLYLLRHAKSSWDNPNAFDHERPLAPRGERAASRVASHISDTGIRPSLVLCSSALRTRQTLDLIASSLNDEHTVQIDDALYGADADELLARLRRVPASHGSVMIIGHNPGLHDLALDLAGRGEREAVDQLDRKFPTAALATLEVLDLDWDELARNGAYLRSLVVPRELP